MPLFTVTKKHDATAYFVAVIEADTKEEAEAAGWDSDGDFEFSHCQEFDDIEDVEVEPFSASDIMEGVQVDLTHAERDIIIAALRLWQSTKKTSINPELLEIAQNDRETFLEDEEIDTLIMEKVNV